MNKIIIINYGVGNLKSILQSFLYLDSNLNIKISNSIKCIKSADKIILPGQGSIHDSINFLKKNKIYEEIIHIILNKPLLCICVGQQLLFKYSEEGCTFGLGKFSDNVKYFNFFSKKYKIPHIGWNKVNQKQYHPLWKNIKNNEYFYFIHSYYIKKNNNFNIISETKYNNIKFISSIAKENIFAVQFHPEKSGYAGLQLYKNFIFWNP